MIGADPCSEAAAGILAVDDGRLPDLRRGRGGLRGASQLAADGPGAESARNDPPGVFAAGDVRAGASNRVAGAVGDGAMAVRFVQQVLAG